MIHKRPKKSLGQNFLKSEIALKKIADSGEIVKSDVILEIGPGKGKLTEKLLEKSGNVIAVEKDRELFDFLAEKFATEIGEKKLHLIRADILDFMISEADSIFAKRVQNYKIVANIPYNITGAILKKFLTEKRQPELMVLMVQNEVAKRIIGLSRGSGTNKKESILSISVKAYGTPKMVIKVPARYFSPKPKVDSAVISIKNISRKIFAENQINEEDFWKMVKIGFAHKRKKLSSNLKKEISPAQFSQINLKNKRAEDLSLEDWIILLKTRQKKLVSSL